jgi:integrase
MAVYKREQCPKCPSRRRALKPTTPGICPKCGEQMAYSDNWFISFYKAGKEISQVVGPSRKMAEAAHAKQVTAIREGRFFDRSDDYTWTDAVDKFRKWFAANTMPKTIAMYENSLKMLGPHFDQYYLSQITPEMVDDFKSLRLLTVTNSTVNRDLATIKRLFSLMCEEWRLIHHNPLHSVKKLKENPSRIRFLSDDEANKLLAACDKKEGDGRRSTWLRMAVLIALNTGIRKETITSLRWDEVDFKASFIKARTKGEKMTSVPIVPELKEAIESYHKVQKAKTVLSPYLFPSHKDARRPIRADIHGSFDNACKAAGIKDFRFHDLRHTFARNFYKRTRDWKALTTLLSHSDVSITMKIYVNFDDGDLTEAMKRFAGG